MIKTDQGKTQIEGTIEELSADLSIIIIHLKRRLEKEIGEELTARIMTRSIERAFWTRERLNEEYVVNNNIYH